MSAISKRFETTRSTRRSELVEKAAGLMGFTAVRVTDPKLKEVAVSLPEGRVFGSGKAFVPFVKQAVYDQLAGLVQPADAQEVGSEAAQEDSDGGQSSDEGSRMPPSINPA